MTAPVDFFSGAPVAQIAENIRQVTENNEKSVKIQWRKYHAARHKKTPRRVLVLRLAPLNFVKSLRDFNQQWRTCQPTRASAPKMSGVYAATLLLFGRASVRAPTAYAARAHRRETFCWKD